MQDDKADCTSNCIGDHDNVDYNDDCSNLLNEWNCKQVELSRLVISQDAVKFAIDSIDNDDNAAETNFPLRYIGGLDISFVKESKTDACATFVILDSKTLNVIHEETMRIFLHVPYIPGYLAFREVPHFLELIRRVRDTRPDIFPDVILLDGNGIFHPRGLGVASHLGVLENICTIGASKTFLNVDGLNRDKLDLLFANRDTDQDFINLYGDSGCLLGAALFPTIDRRNPVCVSIGHKISLETSLKVVRHCSQFRIAEPIRQADIRSRAEIRRWVSEK